MSSFLDKLMELQQQRNLKLAHVESPFKGPNPQVERLHVLYAHACMRHAILNLNYAALASHLLYTLFLDDGVEEERNTGILCGFLWNKHATSALKCVDLGVSAGMEAGIKHAESQGRKIVVVELGGIWSNIRGNDEMAAKEAAFNALDDAARTTLVARLGLQTVSLCWEGQEETFSEALLIQICKSENPGVWKGAVVLAYLNALENGFIQLVEDNGVTSIRPTEAGADLVRGEALGLNS